MTTPVVTPVIPSKNKTWLVTAATVVGLIISGLTWVAPVLPEKFSAIALLVIGVLTPVGAYLAKYKEPDEVIVKKADIEATGAVVSNPVPRAQVPLPPPDTSSDGFTSRKYDSPYE